jgi:hypothetical protein
MEVLALTMDDCQGADVSPCAPNAARLRATATPFRLAPSQWAFAGERVMRVVQRFAFARLLLVAATAVGCGAQRERRC